MAYYFKGLVTTLEFQAYQNYGLSLISLTDRSSFASTLTLQQLHHCQLASLKVPS